jgi:hypothetical protein
MADPPLVVPHDGLRAFIAGVLCRWGARPAVATLTADRPA